MNAVVPSGYATMGDKGAGLLGVSIPVMNSNKFFFCSDVDLPVKVKILTLDGLVQMRDYYVTAQIWSDGSKIGPPMHTGYGKISTWREYGWNAQLTFAVKYLDLPVNSQMAFTIWDVWSVDQLIPLGGCTIPLFSKKQTLRKGRQKLHVWEGRQGCGAQMTSTPGKLFEKNDQEKLGKLIGRWNRGKIVHVDWLDPLATSAMSKHNQNSDQQNENSMTLFVEFAEFEYPVLHSPLMTSISSSKSSSTPAAGGKGFVYPRNAYTPSYAPPVPIHPPNSYNSLPSSTISSNSSSLSTSSASSQNINSSTSGGSSSSGNSSSSGSRSVQAPVIKNQPSSVFRWNQNSSYQLSNLTAIPYDPDVFAPFPSETKHFYLTSGRKRTPEDAAARNLKPSLEVKNLLNRVLAYTITQEIPADEREKVWEFRFYLRSNRKALTKFVRSVNWMQAWQAEEALRLMNMWEPIDIEDALELLSVYYVGYEGVRTFAVNRLCYATDDEICTFLMQLVAALRYDKMITNAVNNNSNSLTASQQQQQMQQQSKQSSNPNNMVSTSKQTTPINPSSNNLSVPSSYSSVSPSASSSPSPSPVVASGSNFNMNKTSINSNSDLQQVHQKQDSINLDSYTPTNDHNNNNGSSISTNQKVPKQTSDSQNNSTSSDQSINDDNNLDNHNSSGSGSSDNGSENASSISGTITSNSNGNNTMSTSNTSKPIVDSTISYSSIGNTSFAQRNSKSVQGSSNSSAANQNNPNNSMEQQQQNQQYQAQQIQQQVHQVASMIASSSPSLPPLSDLATFLITKALSNDVIGCYFYWFLQVETMSENPADSELYKRIFAEFLSALSQTEGKASLLETFKNQEALNKICEEICSNLKSSKQPRQKKIEKLRESLKEGGQYYHLSRFQPMPLPLDPNLNFEGIHSDASIFNSAMNPIRLNLKMTHNPLTSSHNNSSSSHPNSNQTSQIEKPLSVMFKMGDDLRQDQLVVQLISLMDHLLKKEHLDLKLTPYKVLATSRSLGMIELVPQSTNIADVLKKYEGDLLKYLRHYNPRTDSNIHPSKSFSISNSYLGESSSISSLNNSAGGNSSNNDAPNSQPSNPTGAGMFPSNAFSNNNNNSSHTIHPSSSASALLISPVSNPSPLQQQSAPTSSKSLMMDENVDTYGVAPEALNNFVRSNAGYCVITYLLGIGDRHLDNLLITHDGRLFHIDFGFIMGRDPKPFPPPMKLCKEMVFGMGGYDSPHYNQFKNFACEAYNILRKSGNLILNLCSLMVDSNLEDMQNMRSILKIQEKLKLDLTDEEATLHLQTLLTESVKAIMPSLMEKVHQWAKYWRN